MNRIKLVFILIISVLFFMSCNNQSQKSIEENAATIDSTINKDTSASTEITEITFAELTDSAALALSNRIIKIKGIVDHVCKHGGKRLMLVGQNPGERLRVEAGNKPPFNQDLTGSEIEVTGTLKTEKIDSTYIANWENELLSKKGESINRSEKKHLKEAKIKSEEHDGKEEINEQLNQIKQLKEIISKNDKGYIISKEVELIEYKKLK